MSDRVTETARQNRQGQSGPGLSVQGRAADPGGAVAVQDRMNVSLAAKGQKGFIPPKQEPGEDAGTYARRVADARAAFRQKEAMSR